MIAVDVDDAKMAAFLWVGRQCSDRDVGGGILVLLKHAAIIHFVNVVAGEDDHVFGLLGTDGIDVLIYRVGGPHVPVLADPLHGWQDFDELADFTAKNVPAFADLTIQRESLVLREDIDATQAGVDAVGKRDVDDAVDAAESHCRLGAVAGERIEALACAPGEQDSERIFHRRTRMDPACDADAAPASTRHPSPRLRASTPSLG